MIKCPHCGMKTLPTSYVLFSQSGTTFSCSSCEKHSVVPYVHNIIAGVTLFAFFMIYVFLSAKIALSLVLIVTPFLYIWMYKRFKMIPLNTSNSDFVVVNKFPIGIIAFALATLIGVGGFSYLIVSNMSGLISEKNYVIEPYQKDELHSIKYETIYFISSILYSYDRLDMKKWFIPAARHNNLEALQVFIKRGADINMQDSRGYTAVKSAIDYESFEAAKLLLENGANANIKFKYKGLIVSPIQYYIIREEDYKKILFLSKQKSILDDTNNLKFLFSSSFLADLDPDELKSFFKRVKISLFAKKAMSDYEKNILSVIEEFSKVKDDYILNKLITGYCSKNPDAYIEAAFLEKKSDNILDAIKYYEKAYKLGRTSTSKDIAFLYYYALDNQDKAMLWYGRAYEADRKKGIADNLKIYIEKINQYLVEISYLLSHSGWDMRDAYYPIAVIYDEKLKDYPNAIEWYEKAYNSTWNLNALNRLAYIYEHNLHDDKNAEACYKRAYNKKWKMKVANILAHPRAYNSDDNENSKILYKKSVEKNYITAMENLGELYHKQNKNELGAAYLISLIDNGHTKPKVLSYLKDNWKLSNEEIKKAYKLQQTLDIPKHYTGGID